MIWKRPRTRSALQKRYEALKREAQPHRDFWEYMAQEAWPHRLTGFETGGPTGSQRQRNWLEGAKRIRNSKPQTALENFRAAMTAGVSSPARPWYQLSFSRPELADNEAAKKWLAEITLASQQLLAKTDFYRVAPDVYELLGCFGTAVCWMEESPQAVLKFQALELGTFVLGKNGRGEVDTIIRQTWMTLGEMADAFGVEYMSDRLQEQLKNGGEDTYQSVLHAVMPNPDFQPEALGPEGKRWLSLWWEYGTPDEDGKFLREGGYDSKPFAAPRWSVQGHQVYGRGLGALVIGDCKQLQLLEANKALAVEQTVAPPLAAPVSMSASPFSLSPGTVTWVPETTDLVRPLVQINPAAIPAVSQLIRETEARIERGLYADLWLLLQDKPGQMTATEVDVKNQEKMTLLGAALESMQSEFLAVVIERLVEAGFKRGLLPPPPPELLEIVSEAELAPTFISTMAVAQRAVAAQGLDRIVGVLGALSPLAPSAVDVVDADKMVREYVRAYGVTPDIVRTEEELQDMRAERQQQQAEQAQTASLQSVATSAAKLGQADMSADSALGQLMGAANAAR